MALQAQERNKGTPVDFLTFISKFPTSIPKGAQWAVQFLNLNSVERAIQSALSLEPNNSMWKIYEAAQKARQLSNDARKGCMFCTAISLPGDAITVTSEGIKTNNFVRSHIGAGRNDFPEMRMSFIDTNLSFADSLLRGWSLATGAYGMVARSGNKNYRTDMTCWKFGVKPSGPVALQKIHFQGICCVGVSDEELNYDPTSSYVRREARFVYHSYSIDMPTIS